MSNAGWNEQRTRRLRVSELFFSLQGEGSRAGLPTVFLRLTGCALRCRWCDTTWAFQGGRWQSLEELEQQILAWDTPRLCLTGGEPLLQPEAMLLLQRLLDQHQFDVSVETGGDQDISIVPTGAVRIVDIKLPGSGMQDRFDLRNLDRLTPRDELKFVIADRGDYEVARRWIRGQLAAFRGELLLSPVHGEIDPSQLAAWCLEDRLRARVQLQLHKLLWPQRDRGV
jgi:7-carboxy-7-deazaguanine synthase